MIIGGYLPCSLCDFPGKVAAVVFTQGCNFRCPFCHNGGLLPLTPEPSACVSTSEVLTQLAGHRHVLDGVVVTGGEPCIQETLPDFLSDIRALGLAVKLDTNGSRPDMLGAVLDAGLLDYVAMDVKAPLAKYSLLTGGSVDTRKIMESMEHIAQSDVPHEFRTTVVPKLLRKEDIQEIRAMLPEGSCHRCQAFRPVHALDAALRNPEP